MNTRESLSWRDLFDDIGFFPWIFGVVFGTPAIISLLQAALVTGELSSPLQSVIDAYLQGMQVFGDLVEPRFRPLLSWLGGLFHWDLHLYPHWRHLFVLSLVLWLAFVRIAWQTGAVRSALSFLAPTICGLIGSIAAGLVDLSGGWWAQGLIAALPLAAGYLGLAAQEVIWNLTDSDSQYSKRAGALFARRLVTVALTSGADFLAAAGLSFLPDFHTSSGILVLAAFVVQGGLVSFFVGAARRNVDQIRIGLTMLGGFGGTGLVIGLDWVLKHFG